MLGGKGRELRIGPERAYCVSYGEILGSETSMWGLPCFPGERRNILGIDLFGGDNRFRWMMLGS